MNETLAASRSSGIVAEIRTYRIKAGRREEFLQYFHANVAPVLRSKGMGVVGPFRDIENSHTLVWLRTFPSLDDRQRMLKAFHETDEWKNDLKEVTGGMIEEKNEVLVLLP
jgi:quinol monooxygenase YgiN